jgi:hypothetical protein
MSTNDKTRPAQLIGLAATAALFLGGVVLAVTRDIGLASIAGGGAFVITTLVLAMIVLAMSPQIEIEKRENPHE